MSEPPDPRSRRIPGAGSTGRAASDGSRGRAAGDDSTGRAAGAGERDARRAQARRLDHDLLRRAQTGEEQAFSELVQRYERRAWRVARNLLPSDEDAQDLAQEAFLRVFRNLHRFDFEHDFTTWLYRIVTNLCIDHLRKRRPTISTSALEGEDERDLDLPDHRQERPSDGIESRETAEGVRACLEALAPHFQSVLVLRELEGLPCTEIAEIVGATHVTVRWRLHRGRKLFQEEWERRERLSQAGLGEDAWLENDPD
ncbi:MAG: sigma-70 family RNA polymerase sigma factor [Planctomycetota bacterium]